MIEPLTGLTDIAWPKLRCAYGPADTVPGFLRDAASQDPGRQAAGVAELWQNVWHQGTVYTCTPHAVPFLAALVADVRLHDSTRAQLALLLASIASANSFVLAERSQPFVPAALREANDPPPSTELDQDCRKAVANASRGLDDAFNAAPEPIRAALVAVAAAIAPSLSSAARQAITALVHGDDPLLAHAAQLVLALTEEQPITQADLVAHAVVDEEAADYLSHIADWSAQMQAVELVRELSERSVTRHLT
jgi:hypothetical protein